MFGFDPIFSLLGIFGMGLVFIPQMIVKSTYENFLKLLPPEDIQERKQQNYY